MLYLLAIVFPPLALLFIGRWFQMVLNILLTLLFWFPGAIHACLLVSKHYADQRHKEMMKVMNVSVDVRHGMAPKVAVKRHDELMRNISGANNGLILAASIAVAVIGYFAWRSSHHSGLERSSVSPPNADPPSPAQAGTRGKEAKKVPPPRTGDKYQQLTLAGKVYANAEILDVGHGGIKILHSAGAEIISTAKLPAEWRAFCEALPKTVD